MVGWSQVTPEVSVNTGQSDVVCGDCGGELHCPPAIQTTGGGGCADGGRPHRSETVVAVAGLAGLPLHTSLIDFLAGGGWQLIRGGCADLCVSSQRDQAGGGPVSHTHRSTRPAARCSRVHAAVTRTAARGELVARSSGQLLSHCSEVTDGLTE